MRHEVIVEVLHVLEPLVIPEGYMRYKFKVEVLLTHMAKNK